MNRHAADPGKPPRRADIALAACVWAAFALLAQAIRIPAYGDDLLGAGGPQPELRWLAIAAHLALSCVVAAGVTRRARYPSARIWALLVLCANPAAHSALTARVSAWTAALYGAWLVAGACAAVVLLRYTGARHRPITRAAASVGLACMAGMGFLQNAAWLRSDELATRPLVTLAALRPARALVLNMPSALAPPRYGRASIFLPAEAQLEAATGATFAQMIEGRVGAPGGLNALRADYGDQLRLNRAQWLARAPQHDAIILGPAGRMVGGISAGGPGGPALAAFALGGSQVRLISVRACAGPQTRVETVWERASGDAARGKLFRHALRNGGQIAQDDTVLLGDMLDLAEIPPGQRVRDIAYFDADGLTQVRIGVYDWQTGERWLATRADGSQWPENAVTVEADGRCA